MRLPIRKSALLKKRDDEDIVFLTKSGAESVKRELERLERVDRPKAIEDVSVAVKQGDLSENAEYQEAKSRLARTESRIFSLKERLKRISIIQHDPASGSVQLGSTVVVEVQDKQKTYEIVGPRESNPARGRISHVSPLGAALLHHAAGESVNVETPQGETTYRIIEIR
jgi:transcription elongation factor GreA